MVKISVVVPVYNVEDYLGDCIESLINQTFKDIEIICINDGSKDSSLEILREYEKKDPRIKVFDQENGGHAVATNRGMDMATGDYLFCMDSDDVLELNALELSYNKAEEKDVDFVIFKAINYNNARDEYYETEVYSMNKVYKKVGESVFNYKDLGDLIFEMSVTPWSKLYKREFIVKNNIRYPEGLIFEDNVFFYNALLSAKRICFLNEFLFIRRWYSTSSTTAGDLRFLNSVDVTNLVIKTFEDHDEYSNFKKKLWNFKIRSNMMRYRKIKPEFKETFFQEYKKDLLRIISNPEYVKDIQENLSYKYKKMLEQFLVSNSSFEYDKIRQAYASRMKEINLKRKFNLNNHFEKIYASYDKLPYDQKEDSFNGLKRIVTELTTYRDYDNINKKLSYKNKLIMEQVMLSDNFKEFEALKLREDGLAYDNFLKFKDKTEKIGFNGKLLNSLFKYSTARIDIKNSFIESNKVEILSNSDVNAYINTPKWFKDKKGVGTVITSSKGVIDLEFKCVNKGNLIIALRGKRYSVNDIDIPIYLEYTKFLVNGENILEKPTIISHDTPFKFRKEVKNGDEFKIHIEWTPV